MRIKEGIIMTVKTDVTIDGVKMPACDAGGITISPRKLYDSNAGRSKTTGEFIGDIVAIKYECRLSWTDLTEDNYNIIDNAANNTTVVHKVKMMFNGKTYETKNCYISDPERTISKQRSSDEKLVYSSVSISIIEI